MVQTGAKAKWVELPDCPTGAGLTPDDVPLKDDLSNAIIATCKAYSPTTETTVTEEGPSAIEAY